MHDRATDHGREAADHGQESGEQTTGAADRGAEPEPRPRAAAPGCPTHLALLEEEDHVEAALLDVPKLLLEVGELGVGLLPRPVSKARVHASVFGRQMRHPTTARIGSRPVFRSEGQRRNMGRRRHGDEWCLGDEERPPVVALVRRAAPLRISYVLKPAVPAAGTQSWR